MWSLVCSIPTTLGASLSATVSQRQHKRADREKAGRQTRVYLLSFGADLKSPDGPLRNLSTFYLNPLEMAFDFTYFLSCSSHGEIKSIELQGTAMQVWASTSVLKAEHFKFQASVDHVCSKTLLRPGCSYTYLRLCGISVHHLSPCATLQLPLVLPQCIETTSNWTPSPWHSSFLWCAAICLTSLFPANWRPHRDSR